MKVALTNHPLVTETGLHLPLATIHVSIRTFLWGGVLRRRVVVTNYGAQDVSAQLTWTFGADYADIFEVREPRRSARGRYFAPEVASDQVTLGYHGQDDVRRRTHLTFEPLPTLLPSLVGAACCAARTAVQRTTQCDCRVPPLRRGPAAAGIP